MLPAAEIRTSWLLASMSDEGVPLVSKETAVKLIGGASSSEYRYSSLTEGPLSARPMELGSSDSDELQDWRFSFEGSASSNTVFPSFSSHFVMLTITRLFLFFLSSIVSSLRPVAV